MATARIAITLDEGLVDRIDRLVRERVFPNRNKAIQEAVKDKVEKLDQSRLAAECAKLEPHFEQAMADEGLSADFASWPEY